jgi:mannose-6-phosphate isomerase
VLRGTPDGAWVRYDTDAAEFLLRRLDDSTLAGAASEVPVPGCGPRILLCIAGSAKVRAGGSPRSNTGGSPRSNTSGAERELARGQALWLGAADVGVTVMPQEPGTQLFLACDGLDG